MEELSRKITEYRKKSDLTQKDLGDKLNVSPQAVSKWENGQAEPDASTIKKLCEIFKISTDELFGIAPPEKEPEAAENNPLPAENAPVQDGAVQAEPAQAEQPAPAPAQDEQHTQAEQPAPAPQVIVERVVEQKIINGYCERCKKPVGPGEYVVEGGRTQHIYCNKCKAEMDKTRRIGAYADFQKENRKSLILGSLIAVGVTALFCLVFMLIVTLEPMWMTALLAVAVFIGWFAFGIQVFWEDSVVLDIFLFFLKSFTMPGVIFTLDLDGLIFLILVKIGGAILSAILSVIVFLFGLLFTPVAAIFILPFAAIKRSVEGGRLKADANK